MEFGKQSFYSLQADKSPNNYSDDKYSVSGDVDGDKEAHLELKNDTTGQVVHQWKGADVKKAITDGQLDARNYKESAIKFALHNGTINKDKRPESEKGKTEHYIPPENATSYAAAIFPEKLAAKNKKTAKKNQKKESLATGQPGMAGSGGGVPQNALSVHLGSMEPDEKTEKAKKETKKTKKGVQKIERVAARMGEDFDSGVDNLGFPILGNDSPILERKQLREAVDIHRLYDLPKLKKAIEEALSEIKARPEDYKEPGTETCSYMVDVIADGHQGIHMPNRIADFFGQENLGYGYDEDAEEWYHQDKPDEKFSLISDDEFAWESIDDYAEKVSDELNRQLHLPMGRVGFGTNPDYGDYGLYLYVDEEELTPEESRKFNKDMGRLDESGTPLFEDEGIQRTVTLTVPLEPLMKAFGYKMEDADPHDDVYHGGYGVKDVQNIFTPKGMDDVEKIFPHAVAIALEDAERDAWAVAISKEEIRAFEDALEKMSDVTCEYQDMDGEMISTNAGIREVKVDRPHEKLTLTIENPEHLINAMLTGVGTFGAEMPAHEAASDKDIAAQLHHLADYFDIYGERKPKAELDSRYSPDVDDENFKYQIEFRLEELTNEDIAEAVVDAVDSGRLDDEKEAIRLAAKLTKKTPKEIAQAVAAAHAGEAEKRTKRAKDVADVEQKKVEDNETPEGEPEPEPESEPGAGPQKKSGHKTVLTRKTPGSVTKAAKTEAKHLFVERTGLKDTPEWNEAVKEELKDGFDDVESKMELWSVAEEPVEHESYPGFSPHTNGGWIVRGFQDLNYMWGSGKFPSPKKANEHIEKMIDLSLEMAKEAFIEKHRKELEEIYSEEYEGDLASLKSAVDYHSLYDKKQGKLAEELSEYESEYLSDEQSSVMFEIGAYYYAPDESSFQRGMSQMPGVGLVHNPEHDDSGHELYVYGTINWEAPYHRSGKDNEWVSETFQFNFTGAEDLKKQLHDAVTAIVKEMVGSRRGE